MSDDQRYYVNGSWQDEKPEDWVDIPVGTPVRYWPGFREGLGRISITTSPVYIVDGAPCVTVERYSGGVALTHIELIPIPAVEEPDVCPYDCDSCHDEDCPCERLGCAGYREETKA